MVVRPSIDTFEQFSARAKGEMKAWLEPWFGSSLSQKTSGGPGGGGGTVVSPTGLGMTFSGPYPTTTGVHSATGIVPSVQTSYDVEIVRLTAEPPVTGATTVHIEANGVSVYSITLASLDNEQLDTGTPLFTLDAGDVVKLRWIALGTGGDRYLLHLESDS